MYAEERHQRIAQLVNARGRLSVNDLAAEFAVTTETVRRDLSTLERLGLLRRVHGGAVPTSAVAVVEAGFAERDAANAREKEAIARAALDFLPPPGSTIVLDAGSTTGHLVDLLTHQHQLHVVTHSVPLAARLVNAPLIDLYVLPGRVRTATGAAVGAETVAALADLRADVVFLATNGFTLDHGLTTPDHDEAAVKRALVGCARRVVLLADSSKLGAEAPVRFARTEDVDVLVTDDHIPRNFHSALRGLDLETVIA